jgi:hypothetical protein
MKKQDIKNELDELKRVVQDLSRDENIDITLKDLIDAFRKSDEVDLSDDIWSNLENTESRDIKNGDLDSVRDIAKQYGKTDPDKLVEILKNGEYARPMILHFGDNRYVLVAGNTRLCTAKAIGITPKVFIAELSETKNEDMDKKQETTEMDASSSGSYEGSAFGPMILKKDIYKIHNTKKPEINEVADASSSGQYDVPFNDQHKKNPLKIDGPDSIYKGRAVKDKKFPKWGGPDSVFVKIKEKCKKFPYCNQGNTGAIEFIHEIDGLKGAITETSKKLGIPYKEMEKIVINEINKIFI